MIHWLFIFTKGNVPFHISMWQSLNLEGGILLKKRKISRAVLCLKRLWQHLLKKDMNDHDCSWNIVFVDICENQEIAVTVRLLFLMTVSVTWLPLGLLHLTV